MKYIFLFILVFSSTISSNFTKEGLEKMSLTELNELYRKEKVLHEELLNLDSMEGVFLKAQIQINANLNEEYLKAIAHCSVNKDEDCLRARQLNLELNLQQYTIKASQDRLDDSLHQSKLNLYLIEKCLSEKSKNN